MTDQDRLVVVVEDDQAVSQVLADSIDGEPGYHALPVGTAHDALDALARVKPDLLLLDVELPDMSGIELYDRIRKMKKLAGVPVIFESAHGAEYGKELRRRGIATFVRKPFDIAM